MKSTNLQSEMNGNNSNKIIYIVFWGVIFVISLSALGTVSYFQHRTIQDLTRRVGVLEQEVWRYKVIHSSDIGSVSDRHNAQRRSLDDEGFIDIYDILEGKQLDLLESKCKNSTLICLRGPGLPKGFQELPHSQRNKEHYRYRRQADHQCCSSLARPSITGPATDIITIQKGQNIVLPCRAAATPPADVIWVPGVDPNNQGRYVETVDGLEVSNAQYVDNGMFECKASNVFGSSVKHIKLNVIDHLTVNLTPERSVITSSTDPYMDFICTYSGTPPPTITWFHIRPDGVYENVTSRALTTPGRSTLHIDNPGALDGGQYICEVKNEFEQLTDNGNVTVNAKPDIVNGPKTQVVKLGETITLKCDAIGVPPAKIQWLFPNSGTSIPKDVTVNPDGSITVSHVDKFSEGKYTCKASNLYGVTTSNGTLTVVVPLTVTTNPEEKGVKPGDTYIQIKCSGSGNPPPTLSWSKKGDPMALTGNPGKYLVLQNGELILTSVDVNKDTGVYWCNGTNGQEQGGDASIIYKDMGDLDCSTTFASCSKNTGTACGGRCPANCDTAPGSIYGYQVYSIMSNVCLAGKHAGVIRNPGDLMIWTMDVGGDDFERRLSNGIQSEYSGPLAIQAKIYYKQINLPAIATFAPIAPLGG